MNIQNLLVSTALALTLTISACGSSKGNKSKDDSAENTKKDTPERKKNPKKNEKLILIETEVFASKNNKFVAKLEWISEPKALQNSLKARLAIATTKLFAPKKISDIVFDPQMPSMGHGTFIDDQTITQEKSSTYTFIVDGIYFIMGGPWEILVTATVDGKRDTVAIPVEVAE